MDEKKALVGKLHDVMGFVPIATSRFLDILVEPDVIDYTKRFIAAMDEETRCTNYRQPWSCIREFEARYENEQNGWLGGQGGPTAYFQNWCENCKKKILEV